MSYQHVESRKEVNELCKWIRRAIAGSGIEELKVMWEQAPDPSNSGPSLCFSGLFDHIVKKQFLTIRVLDLGSVFVCVDHLRSLLIACLRLEELKIQVSRNALASPLFLFGNKGYFIRCFDRTSLPFIARAWYGFVRHHFVYATSNAAFESMTQLSTILCEMVHRRWGSYLWIILFWQFISSRPNNRSSAIKLFNVNLSES